MLYMGVNLALSSAECQIYMEMSESQAGNVCWQRVEAILSYILPLPLWEKQLLRNG